MVVRKRTHCYFVKMEEPTGSGSNPMAVWASSCIDAAIHSLGNQKWAVTWPHQKLHSTEKEEECMWESQVPNLGGWNGAEGLKVGVKS